MQLAEDLKHLVNQYGSSIVEDSRVIGMLMDMKSFNDFPAIQLILKYIINNGYSKDLESLNDSSKQRLINEIAHKTGYDSAHIKYVINSLLYAVKKDSLFPMYPNTDTKTPNKSKNTKWIWLSLILVVFMGAIITWYHYSTQNNKLFRIQENGLYGFIDSVGNVVIEPQYKYVSQFSKDGYAYIITDVQYRIDKSDKPKELKDLNALLKNDTLVIKYGYIDKKNKLVVDTTNILSIPKNCFRLYNLGEEKEFSEQFNNKELGFRDTYLDELRLSSNLFIFQDQESGLIGYKNTKSEIVIKPKYKYCRAFSDDVALVAEPDSFGADGDFKEDLTNVLNCFSLIDNKGNVIKSKSWCYGSDFINNKSWVSIASLRFDEEKQVSIMADWFQIDKNANVLIGPISGTIKSFVYNNSEGDNYIYYMPATILDGEKYTFINKEGKFATDYNSDGMLTIYSPDSKPEVFDDVTRFSNGFAGVRVYEKVDNKSVGRWAFIDKNFDMVSEELYDSIIPFSEGLSAVQKKSEFKGLGEWGVLNTKFEIVIPFNYHTIGDFNGGLAYAMLIGAGFNREGYINRKGEFVWSTNRKK